MYSEWVSQQNEIQTESGHPSVLHKFPEAVGKDVAGMVVRSLAQTLNFSISNGEPSSLVSERDVTWTMEVLCYGLSLPLSETDTIRDCVNIYCDWLSALTPSPKPTVPPALVEDPQAYACLMLTHLHNVFVPRGEAPSVGGVGAGGIGGSNQALGPLAGKSGVFTPAGVLVQRQAMYCHHVLRTVKATVEACTSLSRDTWHSILKFMLGVCHVLLAPPTQKDGIGEQLCDRVLGALFEMWLLACAQAFPPPSLWRTWRDMCATWRHHEALVMHWHRATSALTARVLKLMYGPECPPLVIAEEDAQLVAASLDEQTLVQTWFRVLHIISNPVDLSRPSVIGNTAKFLHEAMTSEEVVDPHQHPCLNSLPAIFHRAMRAVSTLVDAFLGISSPSRDDRGSELLDSQRSVVSASGSTPPNQRKSRAFNVPSLPKGSSKTSLSTSKSLAGPALTGATGGGGMVVGAAGSPVRGSAALGERAALWAGRPRVNSVLHLCGAWLVEAALVGVAVHGASKTGTRRLSLLSRSRTASFHLDPDPTHLSFRPDSLDATAGMGRGSRYEAGRAEALGSLCRLFCGKRTGEQILPEYLARFYTALYYALQVDKWSSGPVLASVMFHARDLLRVDLAGVQVLLPQITRALELVLIDNTFRSDEYIAPSELRKASIHLLLSAICLPLHYKSTPIKCLFSDEASKEVTFLSLKTPMIELMLRSLTAETDSNNTEMLLGGLLLCVQDLALSEQSESPQQSAPSSGTTPQSDSSIETARGLFGHAASLVCNRLMASWKQELNIALAAMEVLAALARVPLRAPYTLMCKRTVNWICEFIAYQCSRPAPAHSKDLHSMIVAAFHCLSVWLVQHEGLLADRECLHCVLEVVELGISGSKSQVEIPEEVFTTPPTGHKHKDKDHRREPPQRASDVPRLKSDKERKPVSIRVQDAAEALLTTIIDRVGSFPPPCGPEALCSLLDEDSLLRCVKEGGLTSEARTPFRYFVLDGSVIVALLEQALANEQEPLPTVTALVRGPFGRHAWTMQLRHLPRSHKLGSRQSLQEAARPTPDNDVGVTHHVRHRFFPEMVDSIARVKADRSVPALEDTLCEKQEELDEITKLIRQQVALETAVTQRVREQRANTPYPNPQTECRPPPVTQEFQTARLFLSHYGLLTLDALKDPSSASSVPPSLVMLDPALSGFSAELDQLDALPVRQHHTVHVFYVAAGQSRPFEILSNVTSKTRVSSAYLELLGSLGWPVDVQQHAGWTGHVSTSWRLGLHDKESAYAANTGGSLYDGRQQVLYWADVTSEIAFVVPSPATYAPPVRRTSDTTDTGMVRDKDASVAARSYRDNYRYSLPALSLSDLSLTATSTESRPSTLFKYLQGVKGQGSRASKKDTTLGGLGTLAEEGDNKEKTATGTDSKISAGISAKMVGSGAEVTSAAKPRSLNLELDRSGEGSRVVARAESVATPTDSAARKRLGRNLMLSSQPECKVFVVWLESYEDAQNFPTSELLPSTCTGQGLGSEGVTPGGGRSVTSDPGGTPVHVIFIQPLQNGLFRVHVRHTPPSSGSGRGHFGIPLVDGMVVSRRSLGALVRQTAINICHRKTLHSDSYQPPHVRRKLKIKDLVDRYRNRLVEPEFYTALFQDNSKA